MTRPLPVFGESLRLWTLTVLGKQQFKLVTTFCGDGQKAIDANFEEFCATAPQHDHLNEVRQKWLSRYEKTCLDPSLGLLFGLHCTSMRITCQSRQKKAMFLKYPALLMPRGKRNNTKLKRGSVRRYTRPTDTEYRG
jgi:hypothetical protein